MIYIYSHIKPVYILQYLKHFPPLQQFLPYAKEANSRCTGAGRTKTSTLPALCTPILLRLTSGEFSCQQCFHMSFHMETFLYERYIFYFYLFSLMFSISFHIDIIVHTPR